MKNTGKLFPDKNALDLKEMTSAQRKVLYYNIMFPGMGFVYAGDFLRSLVFGGGAMVFLLWGFLLILKSAGEGAIGIGNFISVLALPTVCFTMMLLFHVLSILKSSTARISRCSLARAVVYTGMCMALALAAVFLVLATVWHAVPWQ